MSRKLTNKKLIEATQSKKILLCLLLVTSFLFVFPLVSGKLIFQRNSIIDLKVPCSYNGSFCGTDAQCNMTIVAPNYTIIENNSVMTNPGNGFPNITLKTSKAIGNYDAFYTCCRYTECDSESFQFSVTGSGEEATVAQGIIYVVLLGASIFVFVLILYGAIKTPWKHTRNEDNRILQVNDMKFVKLFLGAMSYLVLMWVFWLMKTISEAFLYIEAVHGLFNFLYWIMLSLLLPIWVVSMFFALVLFLENKKFKKALQRGLVVR